MHHVTDPLPLGAADASLIKQLWLDITSPMLDLGKEPIAQLEEAELLQLRVDLGVRSPQYNVVVVDYAGVKGTGPSSGFHSSGARAVTGRGLRLRDHTRQGHPEAPPFHIDHVHRGVGKQTIQKPVQFPIHNVRVLFWTPSPRGVIFTEPCQRLWAREVQQICIWFTTLGVTKQRAAHFAPEVLRVEEEI